MYNRSYHVGSQYGDDVVNFLMGCIYSNLIFYVLLIALCLLAGKIVVFICINFSVCFTQQKHVICPVNVSHALEQNQKCLSLGLNKMVSILQMILPM